MFIGGSSVRSGLESDNITITDCIPASKEQKVSDIAGYLCDLLPSLEPDHLAGDVNSIPNLLHEFMCLLSNFRNEESCYLGPLAARATALLMQRAGVEMLGSCENVVRDYEDGHDGEIIAGWQ